MAPLLEEPPSGDAFVLTLRHAQAALISMRHAGARAGDVLTGGCRREDTHHALGDARLASAYPNTALAHLALSPAWFRVFAAFGPQRFFHMLLTTACFVPLANGCHMQLWGAPPADERRPRAPARRVFARSRLFYARPWRAYRRGIVLGFPPTHMLASADAAALCRMIWGAGTRARAPALMRALVRRHRRLNYRRLLDVCCPQPPPTRDVCGNATPVGRVAWFVGAALRRVVPLPLFGSLHNRRVIVRGVRRLVAARRHDQLSVHDMMQGVRIRDCVWAHAPSAQRATAAEHRKRTEHVERWVAWLVDEYVIPLLRGTFYATEAHATRLRVQYFRHDVWDVLCAPHVARLGASVYAPRDGGAGGRAALPRVRLVPKGEGMRPIVNMCGANARLQLPFDVLTYVRRTDLGAWGASVGDAHAVLARLKEAKARLGGPLFLVKSDVRAAFDSLSHETLLAVLRRVLAAAPAELVVQRYTALRPALESVRRAAVRHTCRDDEYPLFPEVAAAAAERTRDAVFVDSVAYALVDTDRALRALEHHVTAHDVVLGRRVHRQVVGVPQGSVVATMLCSLVLADAERMYLAAARHGHLLRWTDDFLFVTASRAAAEALCAALARGFAAHGCACAMDKTLVNFDMVLPCGSVVPALAPGARMPWCGYAISTRDLSVRADVGRLPASVRDTVTAGSHARPGRVLLARVLAAVRHRLHPLYTDLALNPPRVVYANVFDSYVLAAQRMLAHAHAMRSTNARFLVHVARAAVRHAFPVLAARGARALPRMHIEWLGWFAFLCVAHAAARTAPRAHGGMRAPARRSGRSRCAHGGACMNAFHSYISMSCAPSASIAASVYSSIALSTSVRSARA